MANKRISISKITKPKISRVYLRQRLFRLLDHAREKPVVWINGPAGSGKTTLISSYLDSRKLPCIWYQLDERDSDIATFFYYMGLAGKKAAPRRRKSLPLLTPEYLLGIPTFSKRYFEELYSWIKPPFAIVLDNYQEVASDSMFHEVMIEAFNSIPSGIKILVASREEPVPSMARLQATQEIEVMGWKDICFTLEESEEIIKLHRGKKPSNKALRQLYETTQGWVSGLVLLLQRSRIEGIEPGLLGMDSSTEVIDYFSYEIF